MRRAYAMLGLGTAVLLSVASLTFVPKSSQASSTAAPQGRDFLVPAHDGYGVAECLVSGHTCGQAVADTWCEAQGYVRADLVQAGRSRRRDRLGSEGGPLREQPPPSPVAITCTRVLPISRHPLAASGGASAPMA